MKIYTFNQYIKESGIGGVTVGGINFGSESGNIGTSNFGAKADPSFNQRGAMNPLDNNLIYSELTGNYYTPSDIKEIIARYNTWCKENNEEPIDMSKFGSKTLDYILKFI